MNLTEQNWRSEAACRKDPDLWFPDGNGGKAWAQAKRAKAICFDCPVYSWCYQDMLHNTDGYGIQAGFKLPHEHPSRIRAVERKRASNRAYKERIREGRILQPNRGVQWTPEQMAMVLRDDLTVAQIAEATGKTVMAVAKQRQRQKLKLVPAPHL